MRENRSENLGFVGKKFDPLAQDQHFSDAFIARGHSNRCRSFTFTAGFPA